ncbi:MAG: arylsulfatase family protein [Sphingobacteriaceae bacterium]|jgi:arylsulfatase A-like enzyme|nr:arylsulfatase family protein [Sphingobacteriaceae bacterium]
MLKKYITMSIFRPAAILCLGLLPFCSFSQSKPGRAPNVIIIFADDLGYGDLSCYGSPTIHTTYLDKMASEGMRFTQFYVGTSICTPSRAALLTGRLPIRSGMNSVDGANVLYPGTDGGLPESEITIAEALKTKSYQTGLIGKWHLGDQPKYMPNNNGFDYYFGLPYSNDMGRATNKNYPPLPVYRNGKVLETDPDLSLLTQRYTEEAVNFIKRNKDKPFFLYYASNSPHTPLFASAAFKGKSKRGIYGDVVEELDWSVGKVLETLKALKIDQNTLVIFTSDNGPWLIKDENGGSAGPLSGGKGSPYEGGYRVPAIAWWPGTIKPGQVVYNVVRTVDLFPTIIKMANVNLPKDRVIDGADIYPILTSYQSTNNGVVCYFTRDKLCAVRKGQWKALFRSDEVYGKKPVVEHNPPLLYNVETDPAEKYDVSKQFPNIVEELKREYSKQLASVVSVPAQLKPYNKGKE